MQDLWDVKFSKQEQEIINKCEYAPELLPSIKAPSEI